MLTNKTEVKFFTVLGVALFILVLISYIVGHRIERGNISQPTELTLEQHTFDNLQITAKAAYVLDVRSGTVLYAKNADAPLPLASLTKVMTALVATTLAPSYSTVVVTKEAVDTDGDSGLTVGEKWSLKNLIDFSLTTSSNDGMRAVGLALGALSTSNADPSTVEKDFIKDMNDEAQKIGMNNSYFLNDTGLDQSQKAGGAYGSVKDFATLFSYILKNQPNLMAATQEPEFTVYNSDHVSHTAKNTDVIINYIPGVIASKTGFTDLAGGNLALAFDPEIGRPIIITILGSTSEGRFEDMLKLVNTTLAAIQK